VSYRRLVKIRVKPRLPDPGLFSIACVHVVKEEAPTLSIARVEPGHPQDTGWSFTCGQDGHADEELMVVLIRTVLREDASLGPLPRLPLDHWAYRSGPNRDWEIEPLT
jgi:hypothetical protein